MFNNISTGFSTICIGSKIKLTYVMTYVVPNIEYVHGDNVTS